MEGETIKIMNQDLVRLDRFDGSNFTRWQDKVRFLLTTLKISYILDPTLAPLPEPKENDTPQVVAARKKRKEDELICRGHILNALSDRLYDLYTNTNSAREIWEALENKYKAEEEGTKKFLISQYIDFKFFDEKPLLPQIHELQVIVNKLKVLKIELPEAFQVGAIVAKLPSSWKGYGRGFSTRVKITPWKRFKNIFALRKNRDQETKWWKSPMAGLTKPMRFQRPIILECRYRKDQKKAVVNAIDEEIIATLSDVCVVQGKVQGWWYDTCATIHVTYDKSLFKTFEDAKGDQEVQMGNEGRSKWDLLGKPGIKAVFESALLTACHILNRIPMKKKEISPYELWKGRKPNIGYFKVWGCLAYCKKTDPNKTKLGPRAIKCAFVGYASNSKAYRLLDLESNVIIESREVEFFENLLSDSNSQVPTSVGESLEETPSKVVEQPIVPRKSQRARKEKVLGSDEIDSQRISFYLVEGNREDIIRKIPIVLQIEEDPKTYKEAMASRDVAFWKEAINDEMDSIMSNQTWELVDLPPGSKPIGCKWVFRRKYHTDDMIQTFKARLVAKGFKQREGIDYFDTYAPVARTTSIRILFALASIHNLFVHQMDVKTAFLNGDLNEEVYMEQPEGFVLLGNENKVCKLVKSLYGLKQAPKQWHEKFDHAILSDGFRHNNVDKCVYSKTCDYYMVIVCLYVDDMLILSDDMKGIIETKRFLSTTFKMKDLGEVDTILGIKVKRNSGGYALNQTHYIEKSVAQLEYASAIGSLMYAAQCTRADISFANTKELSLQYSKFPAIIEGYSDASWISSVRDNLSTTGWVFTLGGGIVSWGSKKQTCISHSTMEAEFIALAATGKEAEWLRDLMMDIPFTANNVSTVSIHCDSQATLARAYSGVYNGKSRHISIRHEYVRQLIQNGIISISFVRSSGNLADPFTKPLTRDLNFTYVNLGVVPPLMRVGVSFKKVHEWIEHMAIKVLSKKIMGTRVATRFPRCRLDYRHLYLVRRRVLASAFGSGARSCGLVSVSEDGASSCGLYRRVRGFLGRTWPSGGEFAMCVADNAAATEFL
ncbi:Retrovirus-related Pol polyprotein from transposon TNT 1-94 [Vitis vinifera]|uniref:Retrovirus-related Pol polyprotein from transposon TNT 1-94 n=1 Tax=Vitis vinifera TaxID=29760 RepID=A0A438I059_VITVI|nr:Retrovirus-related Pol polyprotein from transposon TNT 1-94 [Vitis vinifera]